MPLTGIKVLDLSRFVSGPFCSMLLADFGADVIKIESKTGDPVRRIGMLKNGENPYFVNLNRNKRSLCLNLKTEPGKAIFRELVKTSDVVIENFRPNVMERLQLSYDTLKTLNPALIYAGVSGFGKSGPYRDRPAFDFVAQALSGVMSLTGTEVSGPLRTGIPIGDTVAGLYSAFGIVTALHHRSTTGLGNEVQTALVDGLMSLFTFASGEFFATGKQPAPTGNDHLIVAPYGVYEAQDGPLGLAPSDPNMWPTVCHVLQLDHLIADARFHDNTSRRQHRQALNKLIQDKIGAFTREHWISKFHAHDIPCAPIHNLSEAFSDPQVLHQEMILESKQPTGSIQMPGFPVKLHTASARLYRASPQLGEHTDEILTALGYDPTHIQQLRKKGVI